MRHGASLTALIVFLLWGGVHEALGAPPPHSIISRRLLQSNGTGGDGTVGAAVIGSPLGPGYGFMAALMDGTTPWCGGSLIKSNVVLTAGHCLAYNDGTYWTPATVRIGWPDLRYRTPGAEEIKVKRIVVNAAYKMVAPEVTEDTSDFALLVLAKHSKNKPIGLPRKGLRLREGQWAWAAGYSDVGKKYGTTANWFYTNVHLPKVCAAKYRNLEGGQLKVTPKTICTGGQDGRREGVCEGDSGGPLILGEAWPYTQIGVLSWGLGPSPCAPGSIGVNWWASLLHAPHQQWLAGELKKLGHKY